MIRESERTVVFLRYSHMTSQDRVLSVVEFVSLLRWRCGVYSRDGGNKNLFVGFQTYSKKLALILHNVF